MPKAKSPDAGFAADVLIADTGRFTSTTRLTLALEGAGLRVAAICPVTGHSILKTKQKRPLFEYGALRPLHALRTAIAATDPQIIVPCDDRALEHLHELYNWASNTGSSKIAALLERSLGVPQSFPIVSSRCKLLSAAQAEGVRVPCTQVVRTAADFDKWSAGHDFPWVLKADGTFGGRGVRIAENRLAADQFLWKLRKLFGVRKAFKRMIVNRDSFWLRPWLRRCQPEVVVQSHVEGRAANCAVFSWKGQILAGICLEAIATDGPTGPASVVRVVNNLQMMEAARRIAKRLGLSGFFGLDFIIEETTGMASLIEMNPRCTPSCHLQLGDGRDMVSALAEQLSGHSVKATSRTESDLIAYFPQSTRQDEAVTDACFVDIPSGEPELIADLLNPFPERSLLYRIATALSRVNPLRAHGSKGVNAGPAQARDAEIHKRQPIGRC